MKKRIISFLLVLCLLLSAVPITAFAVEVVASGTCGDNITWTLEKNGTLTISGTGAMYDWGLNDYDMPWYDQREVITSIVISEGITTIGEAAFYDCTNLSAVTIPNTIHTVESFAFYRCATLSGIYLPAGVSKIEDYVFAYCENLTKIDVAEDNESFCSIDGILYDKKAETLITWPCGKGNAEIFNDCKTIKRHAIDDCNKITELTIPASITLIETSSIEDCDNITTITIEKDPVIKYLAIGNLDSLENYYVGKESTIYSSVNGVLYSKDQTVLIRCPETRRSISIESNVLELADEAFYRCRYLSEIDIPSSVQKIGEFAFSACRSLFKIELPNGVTAISDYLFSNSDGLQTVIIPASVKSIGKSAFSYCDSLKHILFKGTQEQWNVIEKENTKLPEKIYITYNYLDDADYHVYDNSSDDHCNVCDNLRIHCDVGETIDVEIAIPSMYYDFVLKGETAGAITVQKTSITTIVSSDGNKCIIKYALTFHETGDFELWFWDEDHYRGVSITAEVQKHEHNYITETTEPTCTEDGYTIHTCTCGDTYTTDINALGHKVVIDKGYAATCTDDGLTDGTHCDRCDTILTKQETISAVGHSWDDGIITLEPTEDKTGIRTFTCKTCSDTKTEDVPALGHIHNYVSTITSPTCTEKGYTIYVCTCGDSYMADYVDATGHAFVDGECTVCGADDSNYVPNTDLFELYGANMLLGNNLAMNFYIDPADLTEGEDYYAVITKTYADGREDLEIIVGDDDWEEVYNMYRVSLDKIAAKEMADEITVVIYNDEDEQVSKAWKDSVRDYTMRMLEKEEIKTVPNEEQLALYVEMLNYGAAAQEHFGYNESDLANNQLTTEQKLYGLASVDMVDIRVKGDSYAGTSLTLESNIQMNFYFNGALAEHDGMYAIITYTDHYGNAVKKTIDGNAFVQHNSTTYKISVDGLVVADCRELVTVKVCEANGDEIASVADSIESYTARMDGNGALYVAIMKFAVAAYNSFH